MNHEIESRVTSFLGLCLRAGRLTTGQEACVELIRRGGAALALVGHSIGKPSRMTVAVAPDGMADRLLEMLRDQPRL